MSLDSSKSSIRGGGGGCVGWGVAVVVVGGAGLVLGVPVAGVTGIGAPFGVGVGIGFGVGTGVWAGAVLGAGVEGIEGVVASSFGLGFSLVMRKENLTP